jgi:hypothetical protein
MQRYRDVSQVTNKNKSKISKGRRGGAWRLEEVACDAYFV